MTESAQDASLAQAPVARPQTQTRPQSQQRNSGNAPGAAAGVSAPAPAFPKLPTQPPEVGNTLPGQLRITGANASKPAPGFPDFKTSGPEAWRPFFAKTKPPVRAVQRHVTYLIDQTQFEHVIALLNAAIIEGQAQPWMYEMLAVAMQEVGRPQAEVDRVVLSIADFGNATYESMMYSGAYLSNFDRPAAALRMYRQAASLAPDRPEPYALSMRIAAKTGVADDALWAACGVLRNAWGVDHPRLHEQAEDLLAETGNTLQKAQQNDQLARLQLLASEARRRDLRVRLQWNGTGDLDLSVQDPAGGIASFEMRESLGGGSLLNDGFGPQPENCHEDFVCPLGFSGEYVLQVKKVSGKIVGDRAVLTIVTHAGSASEKKVTKTIQFDRTDAFVLKITLAEGRREQRRTAALLVAPQGVLRDWERIASQAGRPRPRTVDREVRQAVAEMRHSRQQGVLPAGGAGGVGGVGFAPVVRLIPEGATLAAQAVVSADRRYVRLALSPTFTNIIDVAVFSFQGSGAGTTTGR